MVMIYLFLLVLLLIAAAIIGGLVFASRKLPKFMFIALIFTLVAVPVVSFKMYERRLMLSVVPDALDVSAIAYSKEESWGFGPGGNEAGIRLYPLPEHVSKEIEARRIDFFNTMPPNTDQNERGWRGRYTNWEETPIKTEGYWDSGNKRLDIYDYICAYGFCIDIEPEIVSQSNEIVNAPGNYYAYGRIGVIVVSPRHNLVLYFYKG
jgi:hypothetical protein